MAYRNNLNFGSKKNGFLILLVTITVIAMIATGALLAGHVVMVGKVKSNQSSIEIVKQEIQALESQVENAKVQEEEYKKQLNELKEQLAMFEPVTIPDSMKTK